MRATYPAFLVLLAALLFAQAPATKIRVIYNKGWRLDNQVLQPADQPGLPLTGDVQGTYAGDELILACGNAGLFCYVCSQPKCHAPVCATQAEGVAIRRIDAGAPSGAALSGLLASFFRRNPKGVEVPNVRAGGNPTDSVVMQRGDKVHWAPMLRRIVEGRYCFELRHLPETPGGRVLTFTFDWDRSNDSEGIAAVAGLTPGLYAVVKGEPGANNACRPDPDGESGWVVVAAERDFEGVNREWGGNQPKLTELQKAGASPAAVATVRRAILSSLADSIGDK